MTCEGKRDMHADADDDTLGGKWLELWLADRVAQKLTSTRDNSSHWRLDIPPVVGTASAKVGSASRSEAERRPSLRRRTRSCKSARNVWAPPTKIDNDAADSKQTRSAVTTMSPPPREAPERGDETDTQFLYPSEFLKFVENEKVPLRWRPSAVAVYRVPRDAELRVQLVQDVDLEHDQMRVTKAWNRRTRAISSPMGGPATCPIESTLKPLLKALVKGREGTAPRLGYRASATRHEA